MFFHAQPNPNHTKWSCKSTIDGCFGCFSSKKKHPPIAKTNRSAAALKHSVTTTCCWSVGVTNSVASGHCTSPSMSMLSTSQTNPSQSSKWTEQQKNRRSLARSAPAALRWWSHRFVPSDRAPTNEKQPIDDAAEAAAAGNAGAPTSRSNRIRQDISRMSLTEWMEGQTGG